MKQRRMPPAYPSPLMDGIRRKAQRGKDVKGGATFTQLQCLAIEGVFAAVLALNQKQPGRPDKGQQRLLKLYRLAAEGLSQPEALKAMADDEHLAARTQKEHDNPPTEDAILKSILRYIGKYPLGAEMPDFGRRADTEQQPEADAPRGRARGRQ